MTATTRTYGMVAVATAHNTIYDMGHNIVLDLGEYHDVPDDTVRDMQRLADDLNGPPTRTRRAWHYHVIELPLEDHPQ